MCKDPVAEETSNARAEGAQAEWQEMTQRERWIVQDLVSYFQAFVIILTRDGKLLGHF